MAEYTTTLEKRDPAKLRLTEKEAFEMLNKGFRFSIFDPQAEDYRISIPYRMLQNLDRGTVTLMQ